MINSLLNFTQSLDTQYIARQPIVDKNKKVFAYELLYRNSENNFFPSYIKDSTATSRLLFNSLLIQEINCINNGTLVFINSFDIASINQIVSVLNADKIVIEIIERTKDIETVHAYIQQLKNKNVRFALDDYDGSIKWDSILDVVEFIKLELEEPLIQTIL